MIHKKMLKIEADAMKAKYKTVEEDHQDELEAAWDDVSGMSLDPSLVEKGQTRRDELLCKKGRSKSTLLCQGIGSHATGIPPRQLFHMERCSHLVD